MIPARISIPSRYLSLFAAFVLSNVTNPPALAGPWCTANFPGAVYCEDFDAYPTDIPFFNEWKPTGDASGFCSSYLLLDTDFYLSPPWSAKMNTQENGDLGYSVNPISDAIRNAFGPDYDSVIGTDDHPLVLQVYMIGKARFDNSVLTLASGFAHAPTDWVWSNWCGCASNDPHYPIICQQESPDPACPPIGAAPDVPAIAVGFLAYLDSNPCHCAESGVHSPYNDHLAFFDGHKWHSLRQGLFAGSGDFRVRPSERYQIKVTIRTTALKVELTCLDTSEYSWCEIPGGYGGPFDTLATGFHKSCQLRSDEWTCRDPVSCDDARGVPGGGVPRYDNIVLLGGACHGANGVCCKPDTTCSETPGACECESQGGEFAGFGTTCGDTACCPPQPGDHDLDLDVDMEDYGWFQTCLSGTDVLAPSLTCRCVDFNGDGDVDAGDVATFVNCMLGPEVPANPACAN